MLEHGLKSSLNALSFESNKLCRPMCPPDLSSLKWGEDGELSANDTLLLVERLTRAEQKANSSDKKRLNLSSLNNDSEEVVAP